MKEMRPFLTPLASGWTISFMHSIRLQQCLEFLLKPVMIVL